jgi:phage terminase Nu1 subunit (DNA packaging protein)
MAYATLGQIAHILKLTPRMVNLHVKEHGMPRVGRGEYDLVQCVHWFIDYKDQLIKEARRGDETEQQARARLVKATADLRELELAAARRELISVGTVKFLWERIVVSFKTKILSIPSKLPQRLIVCKDINQIKDLLEREIYEALSELSKSDIDISKLGGFEETRPVDSASRKSSTKAHSQRVGRSAQDTQQGVKRRAGTVENGQG